MFKAAVFSPIFLLRNASIAACLCLLWAAAASAEPKLKALIVDGQNNHNWKATTPILKRHLEETGLFAVDVATSPAEART